MEFKQLEFSEIGVALAKRFDCLNYIDITTGAYSVCVRRKVFTRISFPNEGKDFFEDFNIYAPTFIHPDDVENVLKLHNRENLINHLKKNETYSIVYRLIDDSKSIHVRHMGLLSDDRKHMIICVENIEEEIREKKAQDRVLQSARRMARLDDLTGIRNKNAFREMVSTIDSKIESGENVAPFGVVMCDVNELKLINDTRGHNYGDEIIQRTSRIICEIFKHSPVFRIGGDEFVVIISGGDYDNRDSLLKQLKKESRANKQSRTGPVIACGMSVFNPDIDSSFKAVHERADQMMYDNKSELKSVRYKDGLVNTERYDPPIPDERKRKLDSLFGALVTVSDGGYVFLNDMRYDYSRWSLALVDDFNIESEYMYRADSIWRKHIHPDDLEQYNELVDLVLNKDEGVRAMNYRALRSDGTYVMLSTRGFILSNIDGKPEYFGGIIVPQ
ncbi:sensor domain-containing diguanylate cyclase [Eubacterium xylanophilum]|uniref:sensor domain-containing diguanylate cyclase n=1 Tax=Eubacterium xylanophilum TaxID=39497 RepID=UPI00047B83A6|nr:diguanylate cyclase [Eubacterium xylanophilum]